MVSSGELDQQEMPEAEISVSRKDGNNHEQKRWRHDYASCYMVLFTEICIT